jgi:hypothetical protein
VWIPGLATTRGRWRGEVDAPTMRCDAARCARAAGGAGRGAGPLREEGEWGGARRGRCGRDAMAHRPRCARVEVGGARLWIGGRSRSLQAARFQPRRAREKAEARTGLTLAPHCPRARCRPDHAQPRTTKARQHRPYRPRTRTDAGAGPRARRRRAGSVPRGGGGAAGRRAARRAGARGVAAPRPVGARCARRGRGHGGRRRRAVARRSSRFAAGAAGGTPLCAARGVLTPLAASDLSADAALVPCPLCTPHCPSPQGPARIFHACLQTVLARYWGEPGAAAPRRRATARAPPPQRPPGRGRPPR